jgi:hypothetical protein
VLSGQAPLGFRHPLIRSVVYDCADAATRRRVPTALAQASAARGLADAAAWHRAHAVTGPEESVAAQLELTAARARERGGYAADTRLIS